MKFAARKSTLIHLLSALISLAIMPPAQAGDADALNDYGASNFTLRGFGTLGIARSSSSEAEFIRDLSQPHGIKDGKWSGRIDNILGVQANWQASAEWELVGQVVSRYHYNDTRNPELMWAFAKWEPDPRYALRFGRIGADFMMLADSRLVGYSYLPVRPSPDFFGPLFFSHFDGADAALTMPLGEGLLRGKLFLGATDEKAYGTPGVWDTNGSPVGGLVLTYQTGAWTFRANSAGIRFASDIKFAPLPDLLRGAGLALGIPDALVAADALTTDGKTARFDSLGIVYDDGPLLVQGMLNRIHHESGVFQNSHAGYVLAGYRIDSVTPYAGVAWWRSRFKSYQTGLPDVDPFTDLNDAFNIIMHASGSDQTTYTLGLRWDFMPNADLKLQWDGIRGSAASRFPFPSPSPNWDGNTDVISATIDFIF